jgi:hypothetical protein
LSTSKQSIPPGIAFQVLDGVIDKRFDSVMADRNLKVTNRWDMSDCFYNTRKKLDALGYDVSIYGDREKRKALTTHVKDYCDRLVYCQHCKIRRPDLMGVNLRWIKDFTCRKCHNKLTRGIKRHDIGIFPADRAVMAFNGRSYSVSFENYKALAHLGADVVCVEKEGTVDKQVPFTTGVGIALVQSQGFLSEYGEMLAEEASRAFPAHANVGMLTDFDASGFELAYKIKGVTRLGINLHSIDEINEQRGPEDEELDPLDLLEEYNGANHWINLDNLSKGMRKDRGHRNLYQVENTVHNREYIDILNQSNEFSDGTEQTYIEFIKDKRIELNTVLDEIGAERFWKWLKSKLTETFPSRNYNRAIDVPTYVFTPTMDEFQEKLQKSIAKMLQLGMNLIRLSVARVKHSRKYY